jgi:hypothetical protein
MIPELQKKDIDPKEYAEKIIKKPDLIKQYLDGLLSKNETYRYNCFKVIFIVLEESPDILYPYWEFFENHLRSKNNYHKMSAVLIIANLTSVDKEKKFEKLFDEFYGYLKSKKTITSIYIVKSSGKIAKSKPHLMNKITKILLNIEKIHPGKQIELVKSAVIESFSDYFEKIENKKEVITFVKKQTNSDSPKTRKIAKDFLNKYGKM